jgi:hypothetical protein
MGQDQGTEGCFNHCPQEKDVTSLAQKDCCCTESSLGKVAEGTKDWLEMQFDLKPCDGLWRLCVDASWLSLGSQDQDRVVIALQATIDPVLQAER